MTPSQFLKHMYGRPVNGSGLSDVLTKYANVMTTIKQFCHVLQLEGKASMSISVIAPPEVFVPHESVLHEVYHGVTDDNIEATVKQFIVRHAELLSDFDVFLYGSNQDDNLTLKIFKHYDCDPADDL